MKIAVQVGVGPGHTALDGDPPAPTEKGTATPTFEHSKFTSAGFACVRIIRCQSLL